MTAANKIILISAVLLFGGFATVWMTTPPAKDYSQIVTPAPAPVTPPTVDELFKLVNEERAKVGVAPLILDERLNKSAQQKADDMFTRNYNTHSDPDGRHGYDIAHEYAPDICKKPGENLYWGNDDVYTNSSNGAIKGWTDSKPHYAAMISAKNTYTGFGISGTKVAQHFC